MQQEQYDEDLEITVPVRADSVAIAPRASVQQVAAPKFFASLILPAPLAAVLSVASRISWRGWLVGGGFAGAMLLYSLQWQKPVPPTPVANPYDVRNIPSYSEAPLMREDLKAIASQDLNMMALLNDEAQRETIAVANGFIAQTVRFSQLPGHKCNGLTSLQCLNTFDVNRIAELQSLAASGAGKDKDLLTPILTRSQARLKVAGLQLAKIMATPPQARRASEQQIIDMAYPVLNSGLPPNQLVPRPATLAKNLQYTAELTAQLEEKNPEVQSVSEFCASLTEEQRLKVKGCND